MKHFEFSDNVIEKVIAEMEEAESFIKISVFQIHNTSVIELLKTKALKGLKVEIFTLPYDSINADVRETVISLLDDLISSGALIYFCGWNVGDPARTSTAVGRWYSYHGKFIVTDKAAIILSANFTQQNELDSVLILDDAESITDFMKKFDELVDMFITDYSGYEGKIRQLVLETDTPDALKLFELPSVIETQTHSKRWIRNYPSVLFPSTITIEDRLYVCPFDGKARNIMKELIDQADVFVYLSTESFTDEDFSDFLVKTLTRNIDLKILTGSTSMDFTDRMQNMMRELLAAGASIFTTDANLHAKLLITDKAVVVSSVNLNKMNLGFAQTQRFWRSNTETMYICQDADVISSAKNQYIRVMDGCSDISQNLSGKIEAQVKRIFSSIYGLRTSQEVKELFAKVILDYQIIQKKTVYKIANLTSLIMRRRRSNMVRVDDFLKALILYYLSERQHDIIQLEEKIKGINENVSVSSLLSELIGDGYVENEGDMFRINVASLLR